MKRSVLVTGGTGFVGSRLVRRLSATGAETTVLGREDGNIADWSQAVKLLAPWRWDAVVHLAGPVSGGKESFEEGLRVVGSHVQLALNLLRALPSGWLGRVLLASSMTVYGNPKDTPVLETHTRRPRHLYGLGKMLAEDVLLSRDTLDAWVVRFPGLFACERREGALFHFMSAARRGEPLEITAAEPTCWDMLHVDDAVEAIVRSLQSAQRSPGPMNVSYGERVELGAVARRIAEIACTGARVVDETGVSHPVFQMDIERARRLIDWPPASLSDRLETLYEQFAHEDSP